MTAKRWLALVLLAGALATAIVRVARSSGVPGVSTRSVTQDAARPHDLAADESRGGHTLERHVGRSADELRRRLADEPGISAASSFSDRATAERVVAAALERDASRVARWLSGGGGNLTLDYRGAAGEVIGLTLARGDRQPVATGAARIVLRRGGGSFFVLTAYPVEPR